MLTGEPITSGYAVDTSLPEPDQQHFNLAAFAMAAPFSSTVGNFGDAPLGLFRHPSWSNWDITLARRIPIPIGRGGSVRIQIQAYNIFNQVEFTNLNTDFEFTGTNNSRAEQREHREVHGADDRSPTPAERFHRGKLD